MTRAHLSVAGCRVVDSAQRGELVSLAELEVVTGPHGPFFHATGRHRTRELGSLAPEPARFVKSILAAGWVPFDVDEEGTPSVLLWMGDRDDRAKLPAEVRSVLARAEREREREVEVSVAPYALTLLDGRPVAPIDARIPVLFSVSVGFRLNEYEGSVRAVASSRTVGYFRVLPAWAGAPQEVP